MVASILGWDIGGAHLKAVQVDVGGKVQVAKQIYCPLWRGLDVLEEAIDQVLAECDAEHHVVTMTGELADIFQNRREGVIQISQCLQRKLPGQIKFYAGKVGFIPFEIVAENIAHIASMNWLASVQYVAKSVPHAMFVDVGSTTTDIAIVVNGQAQVQGLDDATRMQTNELIYTGVVRTPLMALAQRIEFNDITTNIAAEYFATTADIYTLTGELPLHDYMADTADGAGKSESDCARRIARMVGQDADVFSMDVWRKLAYAFRQEQLQLIRSGMQTHFSKLDDAQFLQIVGCGTGSFLVRELAEDLGFAYHPVTDLINAVDSETQNMASICFPAYAVAMLGMMA